MSESLLNLEERRAEVLAEIATLGDFRRGSITLPAADVALRVVIATSRTIRSWP